MNACVRCGHELKAIAAFCPQCGQSATAPSPQPISTAVAGVRSPRARSRVLPVLIFVCLLGVLLIGLVFHGASEPAARDSSATITIQDANGHEIHDRATEEAIRRAVEKR